MKQKIKDNLKFEGGRIVMDVYYTMPLKSVQVQFLTKNQKRFFEDQKRLIQKHENEILILNKELKLLNEKEVVVFKQNKDRLYLKNLKLEMEKLQLQKSALQNKIENIKHKKVNDLQNTLQELKLKNERLKKKLEEAQNLKSLKKRNIKITLFKNTLERSLLREEVCKKNLLLKQSTTKDASKYANITEARALCEVIKKMQELDEQIVSLEEELKNEDDILKKFEKIKNDTEECKDKIKDLRLYFYLPNLKKQSLLKSEPANLSLPLTKEVVNTTCGMLINYQNLSDLYIDGGKIIKNFKEFKAAVFEFLDENQNQISYVQIVENKKKIEQLEGLINDLSILNDKKNKKDFSTPDCEEGNVRLDFENIEPDDTGRFLKNEEFVEPTTEPFTKRFKLSQNGTDARLEELAVSNKNYRG